MSYKDIKSMIAGELVSEPARVAAHVGATLRVSLSRKAARVGVTPTSRKPSTL
jgi:hypothetical protein